MKRKAALPAAAALPPQPTKPRLAHDVHHPSADPTAGPFSGLSIHLHPSLPHITKRRPLLAARIHGLGGQVALAPTENGVTHVVFSPHVHPPSPPPTADPLAAKTVTEAWLTTSLAKQHPQPEGPFLLHDKPLTPTPPPPPLGSPPPSPPTSQPPLAASPAPPRPSLLPPPKRQVSDDLAPQRDWVPVTNANSSNSSGGGDAKAQGVRFRVATYNVLADKFLRDSRSHAHCPRAFRSWGSRGPRLKAELAHYGADLLCLQEVDQPLWEQDLAPWFQEQGYAGWFLAREYKRKGGSTTFEGCALLFRVATFRPLAHRRVRFADHLPTDAPAAANLWDAVRGKQEGALIALLQHQGSGQVVVAASTHLWYDPKWPDLKVAQAHILCHQVANFLQATRQPPSATPLIIAGDFNSLPAKHQSDAFDHVASPSRPLTSGVYTLLTSGRLPSDHPHHPYRRNRLSPDPAALQALTFDAAGLHLRSAWVLGRGHEPPFTNRHSSFAGCIDYIWVTQQLSVAGLLEMPYAYDPAAAAVNPRSVTFDYTPNERWPSDHLAVGAELMLPPLQQPPPLQHLQQPPLLQQPPQQPPQQPAQQQQQQPPRRLQRGTPWQ